MTEQKELILSLGTNCDQEKTISKAQEKLRGMFGQDIIFTECIWTEPIGITSDKFLNCLAFTHSSHKLKYLHKALKHIEKTCGSSKRARTNNIVKMDIDILKYGSLTLHAEDWERKYIIKLIKECPF
jgi:2-amino-4-hydroxy-6-hydroxymethyldihydropteridine diphosphokinase